MRLLETEVIELLSDYTVCPTIVSKDIAGTDPVITYEVTGSNELNTQGHTTDSLIREVWEFCIYSADLLTARETARDVNAIIQGYDRHCVFKLTDRSFDADESGSYRSVLQYNVAYRAGIDFPDCSTGLCWFDRHQNTYTDVAGTIPAQQGERIACWRSIGGDWTSRVAIQETLANRTRKSVEGVEAFMDTLPVSLPYSGTSGKYFNLTSTLNLTGEFTIYSVHYAAIQPVEPYAGVTVLGGQVAYPHWYYQPACYLNFGSGWFLYSRQSGFATHYSTEGWAIDTPYIISRVRRRYEGGIWKWYIQWTNTPERYTNTNDGWTFPFNYLMHSGISPTQAPPSGFHLKQLVICGEDATKTTLDAEIREKLYELEGVRL